VAGAAGGSTGIPACVGFACGASEKQHRQECLCHNGVAIAAPEVDFGQEKLGVGKMGGIDLPRGNEVLFGQIPLAQPKVGHAELRVGQGIGGTDQHGIHVVLPGLVKVVQVDHHPD